MESDPVLIAAAGENMGKRLMIVFDLAHRLLENFQCIGAEIHDKRIEVVVKQPIFQRALSDAGMIRLGLEFQIHAKAWVDAHKLVYNFARACICFFQGPHELSITPVDDGEEENANFMPFYANSFILLAKMQKLKRVLKRVRTECRQGKMQ